jgi:hypothetical protein
MMMPSERRLVPPLLSLLWLCLSLLVLVVAELFERAATRHFSLNRAFQTGGRKSRATIISHEGGVQHRGIAFGLRAASDSCIRYLQFDSVIALQPESAHVAHRS